MTSVESRGLTELWVFRNDLTVPSAWLAALSSEEQDRAARYRDPEKRRQFLTTRAVSRRIVGARCGCPAGDLHWPASGPPRVRMPGGASIVVSVSHTRSLSALALSPGGDAVGVDLEAFAPPLSEDAIQLAAFTPGERAFLATLEPAASADWFRRIWTVKEAAWKLVSCLGDRPGEVETLPAPDSARSAWQCRVIEDGDSESLPVDIQEFVAEGNRGGVRIKLLPRDDSGSATVVGTGNSSGDDEPVRGAVATMLTISLAPANRVDQPAEVDRDCVAEQLAAAGIPAGWTGFAAAPRNACGGDIGVT